MDAKTQPRPSRRRNILVGLAETKTRLCRLNQPLASSDRPGSPRVQTSHSNTYRTRSKS